MSKRAAERQITSDTVDAEEESEEAGHFQKASEAELRGRVFKQARRTRPATEQATAGQGIFTGIRLGGGLHNGFSIPSSTSSLPSLPTSLPTSLPSSLPTSFPSSTSTLPKSLPKPTFLSELRNLNVSVNEWIMRHVRENPYVDLTPIFRDYEKHLQELDHRFQSEGREDTGGEKETSKSGATDTLAKMEAEETEGDAEKGEEEEDRESEEKEGEESRAQQAAPAPSDDCGDSLFSVRAKLFYKKEDQFTELGVGQLRVLPAATGVRVLLRNDTSLSKVLLNVRVTESVPVSSKANNVFLVCVPNPPLAGKDGDKTAPVTYLIRVKTDTLAAGLVGALHNSSTESEI